MDQYIRLNGNLNKRKRKHSVIKRKKGKWLGGPKGGTIGRTNPEDPVQIEDALNIRSIARTEGWEIDDKLQTGGTDGAFR